MATIYKPRAKKPLAKGEFNIGAMPADNEFILQLSTGKPMEHLSVKLKDYELIQIVEGCIHLANDARDHGAFDTNLFKGAKLTFVPREDR